MDEETSSRVIREVWRREELYHGPFVGEAPDIVLVPSSGYELRTVAAGKFEAIRPVKGMIYKTGTHMGPMAFNGLFVMFGEGVREGVRLDVTAYDIAPTVLHALGLPIPEEVDGKVLTAAFEEESALARRPIRRLSLGLRRKLAKRARELRARLWRVE